jgi:hypothetical protein
VVNRSVAGLERQFGINISAAGPLADDVRSRCRQVDDKIRPGRRLFLLRSGRRVGLSQVWLFDRGFAGTPFCYLSRANLPESADRQCKPSEGHALEILEVSRTLRAPAGSPAGVKRASKVVCADGHSRFDGVHSWPEARVSEVPPTSSCSGSRGRTSAASTNACRSTSASLACFPERCRPLPARTRAERACWPRLGRCGPICLPSRSSGDFCIF